MASLNQVGEAMAAVMKAQKLSLEQIQSKVPKGFWADVKASCDDTRTDTAMSTYWKRNQAPLTEIIREHLKTEGTSDTNVGSVTIKPLALATVEQRIEDLAELVSRQGERLNTLAETVESLSANVANVIIDTGARDTEPRAVELTESCKKETESRMETLEQALNDITDNVSKLINARAEGETFTSDSEEPPRPPKEGRKFTGHYAHVRGVIDAVLLDRLNEASARHGDNVSRALTAILWQFFGKPKLSFEIPENELETLKVKYPAQDRSKG